MAGLPIRQDYSPSELRTRAAREKDCRAVLRLLAIANALEGMTRAEAARLAGMERQALHDAIQRFNAEGPDGLHDRHRSGRPEQLTAGQQAALKAHILRGPEPERDGVSAWRLVDLCEHVERTYGVSYSQWGLSRVLKRLSLSRQKTRPSHPKGSPAAQAAFKSSSRPSCRPSRLSTLGHVFSSGARTKRALARRAGRHGSGMSVGCARRA
ncbi:IS630 family transposase [Microvirga aerilata]|uniref:IS630 family transposase n=1 Tax=Microvirga aerilata TaxID=670292 RepID=UPI0036256B43